MLAYFVILTTILNLTSHISGFTVPWEKSSWCIYSVFKELARRGNNVTIISHYPHEKICLSLKNKSYENWVAAIKPSYTTVLITGVAIIYTGSTSCRTLLDNEGVQNLWKRRAILNVILVEQFNSYCGLELAYELSAPVVGITANSLTLWFLRQSSLYSQSGVRR